MPPLFEKRVAWEERWAEDQPEPERSQRLKSCAYDRAHMAFIDEYVKTDADPKRASMYLEIMIDAVSWHGIGTRWMTLREVYGRRLDFKRRHPKRRLKARCSLLGLLFVALKPPLRDGIPFVSASESEEIRRLTRTAESEERIAQEHAKRLRPPSEHRPHPSPWRDEHELAAFEERLRNSEARSRAESAAFLAKFSGDEKECERQLDIMVNAIRNLELPLFYRAWELLDVWKLRLGFRIKYPKKRLKGGSRWFCLLRELLHAPWRAPYNIRNASSRQL